MWSVIYEGPRSVTRHIWHFTDVFLSDCPAGYESIMTRICCLANPFCWLDLHGYIEFEWLHLRLCGLYSENTKALASQHWKFDIYIEPIVCCCPPKIGFHFPNLACSDTKPSTLLYCWAMASWCQHDKSFFTCKQRLFFGWWMFGFFNKLPTG